MHLYRGAGNPVGWNQNTLVDKQPLIPITSLPSPTFMLCHRFDDQNENKNPRRIKKPNILLEWIHALMKNLSRHLFIFNILRKWSGGGEKTLPWNDSLFWIDSWENKKKKTWVGNEPLKKTNVEQRKTTEHNHFAWSLPFSWQMY